MIPLSVNFSCAKSVIEQKNRNKRGITFEFMEQFIKKKRKVLQIEWLMTYNRC
jgi:hypothetical protein